MISRARLRDLSGLGRAGLPVSGGAGPREAGAAPRRHLTDASSIGEAPPRRPTPLSSRPERDELTGLLI